MENRQGMAQARTHQEYKTLLRDFLVKLRVTHRPLPPTRPITQSNRHEHLEQLAANQGNL